MNQKKIPTILGLLILAFITLGSTFFISGSKNLLTKADSDLTPKNILVTNLDSDSFTVSWITDRETTGFVQINGMVYQDKREGIFLTHFVKVDNLQPEKEYFFKISSGSKIFGKEPTSKINLSCEDPFKASSNGNSFTVKTGKDFGVETSDLISGLVKTSENEIAQNAIVCISMDSYSPISALTGEKTGGVNFLINLGKARSPGRNSSGGYKPIGEKENILVLDGKNILNGSCTTGADKPMVPEIIWGKDNYQCQDGEDKNGDNTSPSLDFPSGNNKIQDSLPTFRGTGKPGSVMQIVVESEIPYSATIRVKPDGTWSWTPPANLAPGEHTVTLTLVNDLGNKQVITRSFTVIAGNPLLPVTSGSESATPNPSATPTPTTFVYLTVTPSPTVVIPNITATPTPTPTPTPFPLTPGDKNSILFLIAGGFTFIVIGSLLIRGSW